MEPYRVALLHAYSADNRGDGLLVDLALEILREAFGPGVDVTLFAHYPDSFASLNLPSIGTAPGRFGYGRGYLRALRTLDSFDLVLGVGGGYLRFGKPSEAVKALLVHGPQLWAASRTSRPTIYLPQSIGPLRMPGARGAIRSRLRRLSTVYARDDRTVAELGLPQVVRTCDMAIPDVAERRRRASSFDASLRPVLSVRKVDGHVPAPVRQLASLLGPVDGYVQSTVGANDDTDAMRSLSPVSTLTRPELLGAPPSARVVIAVRMHAALMALEAGHFVIHLAYERKGFAAFADLGLPSFVHPVRSFRPEDVVEQVARLRENGTRARYEASIAAARANAAGARTALVHRLRTSLQTEDHAP